MKLVETNIVGEMTVIKINSTGTENKLRYIHSFTGRKYVDCLALLKWYWDICPELDFKSVNAISSILEYVTFVIFAWT